MSLKDIKCNNCIENGFLIFFRFTPWNDKIKKHVFEIKIFSIEMWNRDEIYCKFESPVKIVENDMEINVSGAYYGKIEAGVDGWSGVFDTKSESLQAYDEFISKCIDNM